MISSKKVTSRAFTLVEIIVVIIIVGFLATIAVVRYNYVLERFLLSEGVQGLLTVYGSMQRYKLENGQYPNDNFCADASCLDVKFREYTNFQLPIVRSDGGTQGDTGWVPGYGVLAHMWRKNSKYKLWLVDDGRIICDSQDSDDMCTRIGHPNGQPF